MTDAELRELVASLAVAQKASAADFDRRLKKSADEFNQRLVAFDQRLKESAAEFDLRHKKNAEEAAQSSKEINKQIKELGKQIGGLGEKFGSFTEGLALPSMEKILHKRFKMEVIAPSVRVSKNGKHLEIDVLAYANSAINEAYIVEVKSHLREEAIEQLRSILQEFRQFFPEHNDKTVYGILAAVAISAKMRERVLKSGFYVAHIRNDIFKLDVPANFKAKPYLPLDVDG